MVRLRRSKLLTCFYCGKRSSIPNDGTRREFLCSQCDATNYVDENGEITDPPVATEREPPAPRFVQPPPSGSPPSSRNNNIFCDTCLKNQRLFTASLAQYLPDDPSDPINEPLDRKYYKFRRDLEERYPQVCADCEGRVQGRLQAAGYTAQTDHLRRLMANSRARRPRRKLTALDLAERVGRFLWFVGLLMQLMWHLKMIATIVESSPSEEAGMVDPDVSSEGSMTRWLVEISRWLPRAELLIQGSITAAGISIWWNPRFVQVTRGFSRHLLGFRQWYCFQGLIVFFRIIFRRVSELDGGGTGRPSSSSIMPHLLMAGLMLLISVAARRSIRVDTKALFTVPHGPLSPSRTSARKTSSGNRQIQSRPSSEVHEEPEPGRKPSSTHADLRPLRGPQPPPIPFGSTTPRSPPLFQQSFGAAEPQNTIQDEPEEMDWTPTQSQHRAFSNIAPAGSPSRPFSQAPVQAESGPFWYKVPPAPVNPAHKLRNPPRVPIVRKPNTEDKEEGLLFSAPVASQQTKPDARTTAVEFQPPTFFAPTKDDERNSLADMLNKSFSLGSEEEEGATGVTASRQGPVAAGDHQVHNINLQMPVIATLLLLMWAMAVLSENSQVFPYGKEIKLCVAVAAGALALGRMGQRHDLSHGNDHDTGALAAWLSPMLEVFELASLCYVGWETWVGQTDTTGLGSGVLLFGLLKSAATVVYSKAQPSTA
ncbi:hypothetical protein NLU13_4447 [Sarocladium strictum]|uniref:Ima1 N-terminal domain-containing protein n=1 Tax=Sarocladium strictum TaxID=5046 RepID=A0AA39L8N7_SARSR|nr:hypothetical protein NLU13_4447 [Sarocladium strictum]